MTFTDHDFRTQATINRAGFTRLAPPSRTGIQDVTETTPVVMTSPTVSKSWERSRQPLEPLQLVELSYWKRLNAWVEPTIQPSTVPAGEIQLYPCTSRGSFHVQLCRGHEGGLRRGGAPLVERWKAPSSQPHTERLRGLRAAYEGKCF